MKLSRKNVRASRLAALPIVETDIELIPIHPEKCDPRNEVEINVTSIKTRWGYNKCNTLVFPNGNQVEFSW